MIFIRDRETIQSSYTGSPADVVLTVCSFFRIVLEHKCFLSYVLAVYNVQCLAKDLGTLGTGSSFSVFCSQATAIPPAFQADAHPRINSEGGICQSHF